MIETSSSTQHANDQQRGLKNWIQNERDGLLWIIGCAIIGALIGFGVGCGWFTYGYGSYQHVLKESGSADGSHQLVKEYVVSAWRVALAGKVRSSVAFKLAMTYSGVDHSGSNEVESRGLLSSISPTRFWPFNLEAAVDSGTNIQKLDVERGIITPMTSSFLSFVLPWRRLSGNGPSKSNSPAPPPSQMPSISKPNVPIDPYYHPMAFHTLREYIIRHPRGFVHPDLGIITPAPSGAARGIGMVRDSYTKCQRHCYPGTTKEYAALTENFVHELEVIKEMKEMYPDMSITTDHLPGVKAMNTPKTSTLKEIQDALHHQATATEHPYTQQELMLRIPLEAQITRKTALDILNPLLPDEFKAMTPLEQLDDAFLLAILLVYEGGLRSRSRFWPYIATLPPHPSCAMHRAWRQSIVDVLTALSLEMGTDINGWPNEIAKASDSMDKIAGGLVHFTAFFEFNSVLFKSHYEALRWALCQVASRAIAGNEEYGRLRLVPMMDLINHDEAADMFIELKGNESWTGGHFVGAVSEDAGSFVVRSMRHGRRKILKKGQVSDDL
jgi:hypothetical protein